MAITLPALSLSNSEEAFDEFYRVTYVSLVEELSIVCRSRAEAEDVVQEAFARCWSRWNVIAQYDLPVAWVRRVALNLSMSRYRQLVTARRNARAHEERLVADPAELASEAMAVRAALDGMPRRDREILVLRYFADLSIDEIAVVLKVPVGTVKSRLSRARDALLLKGNLSDDRL